MNYLLDESRLKDMIDALVCIDDTLNDVQGQVGEYKYLVIHCTDTPVGREITREDLEQWHLVENGWSRLGYSALFHLNGEVEPLSPMDGDDYISDAERTNGARGFNYVSRHVAYVGGKHGDTRTPEQKLAMLNFVRMEIHMHPHIKVGGHSQFGPKSCPSFDVPAWLAESGITERNILRGKPSA